MKEFIGMFKELYFGTIDMWRNDRKEFWEVYLGMALITFVFWLCFWVILPIVGN
jgi:hypothetical protein